MAPLVRPLTVWEIEKVLAVVPPVSTMTAKYGRTVWLTKLLPMVPGVDPPKAVLKALALLLSIMAAPSVQGFPAVMAAVQPDTSVIVPVEGERLYVLDTPVAKLPLVTVCADASPGIPAVPIASATKPAATGRPICSAQDRANFVTDI